MYSPLTKDADTPADEKDGLGDKQDLLLRDKLTDEFNKNHPNVLPKITKFFKRKRNEKKRRPNRELFGNDEASMSKTESLRRYEELKAAHKARLQQQALNALSNNKSTLQQTVDSFRQVMKTVRVHLINALN